MLSEQGPTSKAADVVKAVQTNAIGSGLVLDVDTLKTGANDASQRINKLEKEPLQSDIVQFEIASADQPSAANRVLIPDGNFSSDLPDGVRKQFGTLVNCVVFEWLERPMTKSGESGYWGYVHVRPDPKIANHIQIFDAAVLRNTKPFLVRVAVTYRN